MTLFGKELMSRDDLRKLRNEIREEQSKYYEEYWKENFEDRIGTLEKTVKNKDKRIRTLEETLADKEEEIEKRNVKINVLESERDDTRDVVKKEMENADLAAVLEKKKELQDEREARLKDRESKLESNEEGRYKAGYTDGVSDTLREAAEVGKVDRDNMAKIAMVSAASHTSPETMKEINSVHQITAGPSDK